MPELPEVETTKKGLEKETVGLKILDVWTDLDTKDKRKSDTISNRKYFTLFKKEAKGKKIISVERRAKNILLNLSGGKTILIHMKMTGHLLYGKFKHKKEKNMWVPAEKGGPMNDPFNRFLHVVFSLSNKKHLAFSDMRKFGKITMLSTQKAHEGKHLNNIGPEPLDKKFTLKLFKERILNKPKGKIKSVLMDQSVMAGIGNIYSDEVLWEVGVLPERKPKDIKSKEFEKIHQAIKEILKKGIKLGGDSMSDYRNIYGKPGNFQIHHKAYRRTGEKCLKRGCTGTIQRKVIGNRSAHFCDKHQK